MGTVYSITMRPMGPAVAASTIAIAEAVIVAAESIAVELRPPAAAAAVAAKSAAPTPGLLPSGTTAEPQMYLELPTTNALGSSSSLLAT